MPHECLTVLSFNILGDMDYNRETVLRENIEAIRLALNLEKEGRTASASEKEILGRYKGFGRCWSILRQDPVRIWPIGERKLFPLVEELWQVIDTVQDQYRKEAIIASLKRSVETSEGTPRDMILSIGRGLLKSMRLEKETSFRLLDPASLSGNFLGLFEDHVLQELSKTAYATDILSGMIQKTLHPEIDVRSSGFECFPSSEKGSFDLVISHIPSGEMLVDDPLYSSGNAMERASLDRLDSYFFLKGLDALREGGVLCFITDMRLLNDVGERPTRQYLMERSNLITAVPLPRNAFYSVSGTEMDHALVILQKNSQKRTLTEKERFFTESVEIDYQKMDELMDELHRQHPKYSDRLHCPNRYVEDWLRSEEKSCHNFWVEPYVDTDEEGVLSIHYSSYMYEDFSDLCPGEESGLEELVRLEMEARFQLELLQRNETQVPLNVLGGELLSLPQLFNLPEDEKVWREMNAKGKRSGFGSDKDHGKVANPSSEMNTTEKMERKRRGRR